MFSGRTRTYQYFQENLGNTCTVLEWGKPYSSFKEAKWWPQKVSGPNVKQVNVISFGNRILADVIRLKIFRWDYLGLAEWALMQSQCPLWEGRRKFDNTQRRRPCEDGTARFEAVGFEDWSDTGASQGTPASTRSWKGPGLCPALSLWREHSLADTLVL